MHQQPSGPPLVVMSVVDRLVGINLYTGQHVWECEMEVAKSARLVVDQGVVLYAPGMTLYCLDYLTGTLRWKVPTGLKYGDPNMFLYAGCILLAATGQFACFNAQSGALLWQEKSTSSKALLGGNAIAAPGFALQIDRRD